MGKIDINTPIKTIIEAMAAAAAAAAVVVVVVGGGGVVLPHLRWWRPTSCSRLLIDRFLDALLVRVRVEGRMAKGRGGGGLISCDCTSGYRVLRLWKGSE